MLSRIPSVPHPLQPSEYPYAIHLLVTFVSTILDPKDVDVVWGPIELSYAFHEAWVEYMNASGTLPLGVSVKIGDIEFPSTVSYATGASVPPLTSSSELGSERAEFVIDMAGEADATVVAELFRQFAYDVFHNDKLTLDEALAYAKPAVAHDRVWVARTPVSETETQTECAGFLMVGRITPHTVAIKHVFTSTAHRRKGIAFKLVRAALQHFLLPNPDDAHGSAISQDGGEKETHKKEVVCLGVSDAGAIRLYTKCGFFLGESVTDPGTGWPGSYAASSRNLVWVQSEESTLVDSEAGTS